MSSISIQKIEPRFARAAGDLISRVLREEYGAVVTACSDRDLDDMHAAYTGHGRTCRVAIAGGQVIGVVCARETPAGALAIARLYVAREHRGTGIATALLDTVHQWAVEQGYQQTILTTTCLMTRARRFYENAGYREYESETVGAVTLHRYCRTGTVRPVGTRIATEPVPACADGDLPVVLERVRGSVEGWHHDGESGDLVIVEHYPIPVPVNYGYTPIWENPADGDPLDAIVMDDRLMRPGQLLVCRPVGILHRPDGDDKLLVEPKEPAERPVTLDKAFRERVSSWWEPGNQPTGWSGTEAVRTLLESCRRIEVISTHGA